MAKVKITQVKSKIGQSERHRGTLRALGLGKIGRSAEHEESPVLAGMLRKVRHLVKVEEACHGRAEAEPDGSQAGAAAQGPQARRAGPRLRQGKYAGRGIKGQKSRSGSHKMRAGFEGGQMPIYMRIGKLRGSTSKDAMPVGPFRTETVHVNLRDLDRFDAGAEVTPESLVEKGLLKNTKIDVKLLGTGKISKKLTIRLHAISASAREKIEKAGGTDRAAPRAEGAQGEDAHGASLRRPRSRTRPEQRLRSCEGRRTDRRGSDPNRRSECSAGSRTHGASRSSASGCSSPRAFSRSIASVRGCPRRASTRKRSRASSRGGGILTLLNLFSGSALSRFSLFALGIMPYVTASIIVQLLTVVVPTLERLQKEGEAGYAKINAVHALSDDRPRGRTGNRLRVPLQAAAGASERERRTARDHHPHAHCRLRAPHVDGRADHEARHR